MNCSNHFENKATNTCNVCGRWFCQDCVLEVDGRIYCKSCLKSKLLENEKKESFYKKPMEKQPNDFISLICSLIPGVGQMYLGFIKRGILIMLLFIALSKSFLEPFSIILWAFSLFDTFKLKNNLQKGIYIEDNIKDMVDFVKSNKIIIIVSGLLILTPNILNNLENNFKNFLGLLNSWGINHFSHIFVIGMIIFAIFALIIFIVLIAYKIDKKDKEKKDKNIDDRIN